MGHLASALREAAVSCLLRDEEVERTARRYVEHHVAELREEIAAECSSC